MTRFLILLGALVWTTMASAQDGRPLAQAMAALRDGDWADALRLAAPDGPAAVDVIEWHRLRAGQGTYIEVASFLQRRPDWPGLPYLKRRSEKALIEATPNEVIAFFGEGFPATANGAELLATALRARGRDADADKVLVRAWRELRMPPGTQDALLATHGALLTPHNAERLDSMLWRSAMVDARRMLPLVSEDLRKLAEARIALHETQPGVDALIEAVPEALRDDPGLAYERFQWRVRKGRADDAILLLIERSASAEKLGRPEAWSNRRRSLARQVMRDGDASLAYRIASAHHLTEGSDFADLEWLSGYLSLTGLGRPQQALAHFEAFAGAVETPISLGRAGYWTGRAHEALGDKTAAQAAYARGAQHQTSFYGLLAAEKAGSGFDASLAGTEQFADWYDADFQQSSVFQAAILLLASGELDLAERFLTHLAESLDRPTAGQLARVAIDLDQSHLAVMIGKRVARRAIVLPAAYYALHALAGARHPVPTEMMLAIARRESEFDPKVVSGAGARGLMQLMPGTAKEVAGDLGLAYSPDGLLSDPDYNARLGGAYLNELATRFDGNVILISAAYNAGPSRPLAWIDRFGDPRGDRIDMIDWIERIPFRETRNYVMRVAESLPVYRARLGKPPLPEPFSAELVGSSVPPLAPEGE